MNRIILIGNGFDLAHGMPTSYNDFINDYWKSNIIEIKKKSGSDIFENEDFIIEKVPSEWDIENTFPALIKHLLRNKTKIKFKNRFLRIITSKKYQQNWVDIENEYYYWLESSYKRRNFYDPYEIQDLNRDFNRVQFLLEIYLKKIEDRFHKNKTKYKKTKQIIKQIGTKIYYPIRLKDLTETSINNKIELEYSNISKDIEGLNNNIVSIDELKCKNQKVIGKIGLHLTEWETKLEIKKLLLSDDAQNYFDLIPTQTLLLNFNYTSTDLLYEHPEKFESFANQKITKTKIIHIHGSIRKEANNPIIFGYGDEIDENYQSIEKLNDNRYLENIKSFKYLETDNYKKLLEFINIGNYQIFIFGHSCGISDRTLLNTLFEHNNCVSIKPFYHKKTKNDNNYSDIIKNISRNFVNKIEMRNKVVNKKYCEPLS